MDEPLILYHHALFADGIAHLLRAQGFKPAVVDARQEEAAAEVRALRPRLILVEDNDADAVFARRLSEILKENPNIGVIRLNIQTNRISIYSARQMMATGTEDLVRAIECLESQCDECGTNVLTG